MLRFHLTMADAARTRTCSTTHRFLSQCYLLKGDEQALTHATISNDMSRGMALGEAEPPAAGQVYMEFGEFGLAVKPL